MTLDAQYDLGYFEKMLRNYSRSAAEICTIRWGWVGEASARTVLDYGSGIGFFRAFAPPDVAVDTFDVMPVPQTGITKDRYDLLTLWDVLEHLPGLEPIERYLETSKHVAISIPILPADQSWIGWKHFKPGEHLFYPTAEQLKAMFASYGFEEVKRGQPECPPRVDIWNFLYRRVR